MSLSLQKGATTIPALVQKKLVGNLSGIENRHGLLNEMTPFSFTCENQKQIHSLTVSEST
jgi:hypothetical protein